MENYIVSARKYRPATFDTVVGQRALTTTLKNAIATGKLAHAYLFCGPRGVGKTTCARIFAKTINCLHPLPDGEACNECESCMAFNEQRSFNIHELDAASNNSVEDIRALIEQVRIPPQIGKYKVYIIDEVHMLSSAAFNAFLKTLEEPPHHAIFILATTEKHKILPTILSRCQIYDFNRISVSDTVEHLQYVASKEGIDAEPEALNVIAQKADGGMRDALSIFDQVVSFTGGKVRYKNVIENLNVLDYEYYFKLTDYFLGNKVADCLLTFNDILNKGFDGSHFITGLSSHFRDLLVAHDPATVQLLEVGASVKERYVTQAQKCDTKFLYRAMKLCNDCDLNYRTSKNKRLLVELTLIQVAQITQEDDGVSSGRSPKQIIKPLFKRPAANTAQQQQSQTAAQVVQNVVPQNKVTNADQLINNFTKSEIKPTASMPKVKHFSIKAMQQQLAQNGSLNATDNVTQQINNQQQTQSSTDYEDHIFNERDLDFYWREFASTLPREETSTAGRMKSVHPKQLNATDFEILVDNQIAEKEMQTIRPRIEQYLRNTLHNRKIQMKVRVSEKGEVVKAYSRSEQWQVMLSKSEALRRLKEEFGLELA